MDYSINYRLFHVFFLWIVSIHVVSALPLAKVPDNRGVTVTSTVFFQFPDTRQAENMIARSNGQILVTVDTAPELWQVSPFTKQAGNVVYTFEKYTSVFGIVELGQDVFYVIVSNFTGPPDYYGEGNVAIMAVDLRGYPLSTINSPTQSPAVKVSKVLDIPDAQLLDGIAIVNTTSGLLVSGDAQTGTLYLLDVCKLCTRTILQSGLLRGVSDSKAAGLAHIGINGMKYRDGWLYWTNTAKGTFGRVAIDGATGMPIGNVTILEDYETDVDDLSFDARGNQLISEDLHGVLFRRSNTTSAQNASHLIANLPGADANVFGRTSLDKCVPYSSFAGSPSGVASIDLGALGLCG